MIELKDCLFNMLMTSKIIIQNAGRYNFMKCFFVRVDIISASWGPSDDGKTVEAPGHLAVQAIVKGITHV